MIFIRTRSYGHILSMLKIAVLDKKRNEVGESMEEGNLLLNRMIFFFVKKKKKGDLHGVWGYLFSNAEEGAWASFIFRWRQLQIILFFVVWWVPQYTRQGVLAGWMLSVWCPRSEWGCINDFYDSTPVQCRDSFTPIWHRQYFQHLYIFFFCLAVERKAGSTQQGVFNLQVSCCAPGQWTVFPTEYCVELGMEVFCSNLFWSVKFFKMTFSNFLGDLTF